MSAGYCTWHRDTAEDVEPIIFEERGSGPAAAVSACLPCANGSTERFPYGKAAQVAVRVMKERAARSRSRARKVHRG
ncbi:hypothetical protein JW613_22045 [Streptomyces smyrnaeus]|uniref:4Fe-4S Wbl-type domain-containing protein n=1 Tax=Streptomyces smyrnaeus TaxID=1387713 RepID=A0ABS3Y1A9_9ACTN|nr:hypothetical protein [Streptomyces smyrnaeus]MBO8200962.1 hypothetical protein [Streptomyces smyrnaeus]